MMMPVNDIIRLCFTVMFMTVGVLLPFDFLMYALRKVYEIVVDIINI